MEEIPAILNEPIFQKGFELAKIANYDAKELSEYEQSYNDYLGFKASMDFQFNQGMEQGMEVGMEKGIEVGMEKGIAVGMEKGIEVGMEKGIEVGMEKGMEVGMEREKENFAKLMKLKGKPIDEIMEFTGLSKEKIEAL